MKTQHGRDLEPAEMAQMLDEFVNGHHGKKDIEEFVEQIVYRTHRTLQQSIMRYIVALLEKYATLEPDRYDARNESTVKLAKKMVEATGDQYDRHLPLI
jgi:uncharacterized protein (DUF2225 family)